MITKTLIIFNLYSINYYYMIVVHSILCLIQPRMAVLILDKKLGVFDKRRFIGKNRLCMN